MRTSRRPWLVAIGVVPLALLLSGCLGLPGIPDLPGGSSGGTGDQTVEGATGGDVDIARGGLPAGFPVEAIPLVDGEVVVGFAVPGSDGKTAWQVTIAAADEATAEDAGALLEAAGFSHDGFGYESTEYLVIVAGQVDDGVHHVAYTVAEQ